MLSDHAEHAAGELEGVDRAADVLRGMPRGDLEPDAEALVAQIDASGADATLKVRKR